jgi:hypothetical protein
MSQENNYLELERQQNKAQGINLANNLLLNRQEGELRKHFDKLIAFDVENSNSLLDPLKSKDLLLGYTDAAENTEIRFTLKVFSEQARSVFAPETSIMKGSFRSYLYGDGDVMTSLSPAEILSLQETNMILQMRAGRSAGLGFQQNSLNKVISEVSSERAEKDTQKRRLFG